MQKNETITTNNNLENESQTKNPFWKNKKNIAIIILSFILFCSLGSTPSIDTNNISNVTQYKTQINELNAKLENSLSQIKSLETDKKSLKDKISNLEEEKEELEKENENLNSKLKDATKTTSTSSSLTSKKTSSSNNSSSNITQRTTVYITKTGSKYHKSSCSYLKKSKISISLKSAKSQGYTACSRCNP